MNLDQLLKRNPIPSTAEMQARLDNVWERLRSEIENTPTEHVSISVSIRPYWIFALLDRGIEVRHFEAKMADPSALFEKPPHWRIG